ncbi:MAG: chorismate-binding protein, partial [Leeuwenhoekiella sp.]
MERYSTTHHIFDKQGIKDQLLLWGSKKSPILWLDSNNHKDSYGKFDALLAVGEQSSLRCEDTIGAFQALADYQSKVKDWIFGYLSYDLKNDIESLNSANSDYLKFPSLYFFQPQKIFILRGSTLTQAYLPSVAQESVLDFEDIKNVDVVTVKRSNHLNIKSRFTKEEYTKGVEQMLKHIYLGDIYEANFCPEFYAGGTIDTVTTFRDLNAISRAPFASYLKTKNQYLLCTSPERYLQKTSDKIISQPIKGTARRSEDLIEDRKIAETLQNDEKERSENIMITDLVRNDLSRIASKGSV